MKKFNSLKDLKTLISAKTENFQKTTKHIDGTAGIYSCLMSNDNYAYKLDIESCCDFLLIHYSDVYFYVGF